MASRASYGVVINLVRFLEEQGITPHVAALLLGLGGVGEVLVESATRASLTVSG